ncbi:hypothetical protein HK099_008068 [Clydaea vesicula]|uniref:Uncharacterized protein n=1 Tax=Clydaea vesicula TaxID=447962 RepID=A0AAD5U8P3_9FUNG|nr:hypothetical protein HK099_008068 [Clydaea vesicula]
MNNAQYIAKRTFYSTPLSYQIIFPKQENLLTFSTKNHQIQNKHLIKYFTTLRPNQLKIVDNTFLIGNLKTFNLLKKSDFSKSSLYFSKKGTVQNESFIKEFSTLTPYPLTVNGNSTNLMGNLKNYRSLKEKLFHSSARNFSSNVVVVKETMFSKFIKILGWGTLICVVAPLGLQLIGITIGPVFTILFAGFTIAFVAAVLVVTFVPVLIILCVAGLIVSIPISKYYFALKEFRKESMMNEEFLILTKNELKKKKGGLNNCDIEEEFENEFKEKINKKHRGKKEVSFKRKNFGEGFEININDVNGEIKTSNSSYLKNDEFTEYFDETLFKRVKERYINVARLCEEEVSRREALGEKFGDDGRVYLYKESWPISIVFPVNVNWVRKQNNFDNVTQIEF